MTERDIEKQPYTADEARVARFLHDLAGIGGGDDPIGFLIASHQVLSEERRQLKDTLRAVLSIIDKEWQFRGAEPMRLRLLREIKEALK